MLYWLVIHSIKHLYPIGLFQKLNKNDKSGRKGKTFSWPKNHPSQLILKAHCWHFDLPVLLGRVTCYRWSRWHRHTFICTYRIGLVAELPFVRQPWYQAVKHGGVNSTLDKPLKVLILTVLASPGYGLSESREPFGHRTKLANANLVKQASATQTSSKMFLFWQYSTKENFFIVFCCLKSKSVPNKQAVTFWTCPVNLQSQPIKSCQTEAEVTSEIHKKIVIYITDNNIFSPLQAA